MTTTMTIRLEDKLNERLSKLANATDRSKAYLATQALKLFLENNEWQVVEIEQALSQADKAGSDEFADNETVMAWMESWGSDEELPAPL